MYNRGTGTGNMIHTKKLNSSEPCHTDTIFIISSELVAHLRIQHWRKSQLIFKYLKILHHSDMAYTLFLLDSLMDVFRYSQIFSSML